MHKINSVCNGLKELIDYVHVDEDRVVGSSTVECNGYHACGKRRPIEYRL